MQIVDKTFFNKNNGLHLPLSVVNPVSVSLQSNPNNATAIDLLCVKVEKYILLHALGLTLYNELFAITDFDLPENERWKKLVQGDEYDGKKWDGLDNDYSLIAYRVYEMYVTQTNTYLSATGVTKVEAENATDITPAYKIATANQNFIDKYQGDYLNNPNFYDGFVDWYGNDSIEKSLYGYLMDKIADFPTWDASQFRVYETKNSFGI